MNDMDEIVQEFLIESQENLDQLDRDLVALERAPGSRELLSSIFRAIHTIKGTSGFLAFGRLEAVAHVGESLLSRLRDGVQEMTPETTTVLLGMVDVVRILLAQIEANGVEGDIDVQSVVDRVTACIEGRTVVAAAPPAPAPEPVAVAPQPETPAAPQPAAPLAPAAPVAPKRARAPRRSAKPAVKPAAQPAVKPAVKPTAQSAVKPAAKAVAEPVVEAQVLAAVAVPAPPVAPPTATPAASPPGVVADAEESGGSSRRSVTDNSIRVDVDLLDSLMRLVGELVLTRNQLVQLAGEQREVSLLRASQRLNLITSELQESVMKTRMQPIEHIWNKLPRVVRDLSLTCGKQVRLEMEGQDTELDRTLLEAVKDPLIHLVRNALDHGIEVAVERSKAGKPVEGVLLLRAFHEGGHVVVEVTDDGAGIDTAAVADKAIRQGLITTDQAVGMSERDLLHLLFRAGFSTAKKITNVSGRGVGMDVVKTNIERIGGTVDVESELGLGTTWRLTIPLTLAIIQALTLVCSGERYAIPQLSVHELVCLDGQAGRSIEFVSDAPVYRLRGKLLPLVRLSDTLGLPPSEPTEGGEIYIAVLQADGRKFGLVVDRVLNTEEIVVKPLSGRLKGVGVYAGATILGDGRVALILDVQALARRSHLAAVAVERAGKALDTTEQAGHRSGERLLIAGVGERRVAIPLDMVTRLEEFTAESIERVGSREVVQYRGSILPVLRLANLLGSFSAEQQPTVPVVVYSERGRSVALAVDSILDIVEGEVAVRSDIEESGLTGSAVIQSRVTELLDVRGAILAADPHFYDRPLAGFLDVPQVGFGLEPARFELDGQLAETVEV